MTELAMDKKAMIPRDIRRNTKKNMNRPMFFFPTQLLIQVQ
jgi:hypothetical protein